MSASVRASVVVVTYNHQQEIARCLAALLPTLSPADEVIVIDNASVDGSADVVAEAYPSVRLVRSPRNVGFGAACNRAARLSEAEFLVFLNPDTEPRPGWLDALLDGLTLVPKAGLATPKLLLARSPHLIDACGHTIHISGIATCRGWGEPADRYQHIEEVAAISGACFAIPRDLFASLDGFDERLFLYYEDDDLSLRARLAGYACIAVPRAIVLHDHKNKITAEKLRCLERNRLWVTLKVFRRRTLVVLVPSMLGAELLAWGLAVTSGPAHMRAKIQAFVDVLGWVGSLRAARRHVRRTVSDGDVLRLHSVRLSFNQVSSRPALRAADRLIWTLSASGKALAWRVVAH